jgi:hypothetical protein
MWRHDRTTYRAEFRYGGGGRDVAPGVGRLTRLECHGRPEGYAAGFGDLGGAAAPDGCLDCKNLAGSMSARKAVSTDSFRRQTYMLPRDLARAMAKDWFRKFPKQAYDTKVESWRATSDRKVEFTMRRLPTAD